MMISCDVLVVGAGPSGSSAARAIAMHNMKTIFIDKKNVVGVPAQCAEGIGEYLFPFLPFKIPKEQLIWKIDGMFFWAENIALERVGEFWKGYSVDRRSFDKWLADLAVNYGADLWANAELINIDLDVDNNIKKAYIKRDGKTVEVHPKIVVAADGCESTILKSLDLFKPKRGDIAEIVSWEMKNLDLNNPHLEQIFLGDFTPAGYAYIFPKARHVANVGVGGLFPKKKLERYFEEFLEMNLVKRQVKNAEYVVEKTKKTPWRSIHDELIVGNIVFSGDAANHTLKPLGEGILPGIISGNLAGEISFKMLAGEHVTTQMFLDLFRERLNPFFDISLENNSMVHHWFTEKEKEKDLLLFSLISNLFEFEAFKELEQMDHDRLKSRVVEKIKDDG